MNYRRFGATDLRVSEVGIGAFPMAGMWSSPEGDRIGWSGTSDDESIALIHHAESLGVNLIDTAEGYGSGHSEEIIGRALAGRRDRWVIATKVSPNQGLEPDRPDRSAAARRIKEAAEASLRRLQTDVIDLYQLHAIPLDWAFEPQVRALENLKQAGKIRHWGISIDDQDAVEKLRALGSVEVLQIRYNIAQQESDGLLHFARQTDTGTLIRVPLAKGLLTGTYFDSVDLPSDDLRYERFRQPEIEAAMRELPRLRALAGDTGRTQTQAAIRFCLDHPGVTCVIAGAKTRAQIEDNAGASDVAPFTDDERALVNDIVARITVPNNLV